MKRTFLKAIVASIALASLGLAHAQDIKERTLKLSLNGPEGHPAVAGMKKFAELVAAKSGDKIKVKLFLGGALGSDQAVTSSVQGGTIEMAVMNSGILASLSKDLAVFDFPFLFANEKESDAVCDGPVGQKLHKELESKGVVGLAYWELGYRQITTSKRAVNKVEDIDGLKLRVIPNPINIDWVKALGGNPTPMPFPEVYGALETKAIDGQENPISVIASNKFWEVQKFVALTNHQYNPQSVIFSKKVWDSMSPAEKKIIQDSAVEATKVQRDASRAAQAANLELLRKNGMTVTELPPAEVAKLREKMKPVIAKYSSSVSETTLRDVQTALAEARK
ncbi:TRAP transporter substrate-binding protein [Piscinibacter sp. XHJ-5]|uniref:TRAP transporter substrate-binding protein n=1 Tax=Piscinibacter sp. XHJ-5 TaxID=3037797 RepID=UPI0024535336|nr:TRAP transporter substrate-binding protein [Piscinibacter sp. XHJ-5]